MTYVTWDTSRTTHDRGTGVLWFLTLTNWNVECDVADGTHLGVFNYHFIESPKIILNGRSEETWTLTLQKSRTLMSAIVLVTSPQSTV